MNADRERSGLARRVDRVGLLAACSITLLFVALFARVVQLQVAPPEKLAAHLDERVSAVRNFAPRGDILDRRGRVLATSRVGYRLVVDPAELSGPPEETLLRLCDAAGLDVSATGERLFSRLAANEHARLAGRAQSRYLRLSGPLEDAQIDAVRALRLRGVHLEPVSIREGAGVDLVGPIVGRVDAEHDGQFGAEKLFDPALEAAQGSLRYVRDARGAGLWIERGGYTPPMPGESVRLSIDAAIQKIAQEELERAVLDADAQGGRVIVLDSNTGEILAMVDHIRDMSGRVLPYGVREGSGEPSALGFTRRAIIEPDPFRAVHPGAGRNRLFTDLYEPGSTFKAFTWAVMTEAGVARPDEVFKTGGKAWLTPYRRVIRDAFGKAEQTWTEALINSSNIGMSMAVERMDKAALRSALLRFGFEDPTGVGLAGERAGGMTSPKNWNRYTHTSVSFGQEVALTPAQLARAFCVFAREGESSGTLPTLTLRAADRGPGATDAPASVVQRAISPRIAQMTRDAMAEIFSRADRNMRQRKLEDLTFDYRLFGKSGTAQVAIKGERGYLPDQYISSYVGAGPVERPMLVCVVTIDDPSPELVRKRQHFGSWVAGPAVRRVLERSLRYLDAPVSEAPGTGTDGAGDPRALAD